MPTTNGLLQRTDHKTGNSMPYSLRIMCGFFYFSLKTLSSLELEDCETGPTVYRTYPRRLESLAICRCHYSVIKGPRVLVWPENR
mgnify:CR=1 FL=1